MHFELQAMVKHKDGSVTPHHFGQERGVSAADGGAMPSIAAALLMHGSQLLPAVQRLVGRCQQRSRRIYGHRRTAAGILQDAYAIRPFRFSSDWSRSADVILIFNLVDQEIAAGEAASKDTRQINRSD
jgi:hypothetical protein